MGRQKSAPTPSSRVQQMTETRAHFTDRVDLLCVVCMPNNIQPEPTHSHFVNQIRMKDVIDRVRLKRLRGQRHAPTQSCHHHHTCIKLHSHIHVHHHHPPRATHLKNRIRPVRAGRPANPSIIARCPSRETRALQHYARPFGMRQKVSQTHSGQATSDNDKLTGQGQLLHGQGAGDCCLGVSGQVRQPQRLLLQHCHGWAGCTDFRSFRRNSGGGQIIIEFQRYMRTKVTRMRQAIFSSLLSDWRGDRLNITFFF